MDTIDVGDKHFGISESPIKSTRKRTDFLHTEKTSLTGTFSFGFDKPLLLFLSHHPVWRDVLVYIPQRCICILT